MQEPSLDLTLTDDDLKTLFEAFNCSDLDALEEATELLKHTRQEQMDDSN